ncbi:hypothetical protein [Acetivibrio straminisolvens]|jgi:hypothetical protein|uniref:hypothetical protein n=1 Tax=Acetivibrio straminisolvens TaxID=253314 RepID=UPI00224032F0|nr:hypothetical protein [Acetivibrio straminisolvens]
MYITNQDRDATYRIHKVYYKPVFYKDILFGWNIYGKGLFRRHLLGTRDTEEEAKQIVSEIRRLMKKGKQHYAMPELVSDELEEILGGD